MILILLVVGFLGFWGMVAFVALGLFVRDGAATERLEADPDPVFATLFDGSEQVVYQPGRAGLTTATLLKGASARGYRFVAETGELGARQVVFTRA